jgi:hypothetical protein
MTHLAIIPFIPDLFIILPAATFAWGYNRGARRRRLGR